VPLWSCVWQARYEGSGKFGATPPKGARLTRSLEKAAEGDPKERVAAVNGFGALGFRQADYVTAREYFEECLAIHREMGDRQGIASSLNNLGSVARQQGDSAGARALIAESLAIKRETGDPYGNAYSLEGLAALNEAMGAPLSASRLWGAAERLFKEIGASLTNKEELPHEQQVAASRTAQKDDAAYDAACAQGRALRLEQVITYALEA